MSKGYNHVTRDERCQIYALKSTGMPLRGIAKEIDKDVSTICCEIKRNSGQRGYRFNQADTLACERRSKASKVPKKLTDELTIEIESKLKEDWSPEQIAGRLKTEGIFISHESMR